MLTVVVPVYNESGNIKELFHQVCRELASEKFELIFVNDGSTDHSLEVIKEMAALDSRVRFVSLSRNFGHQSALRAGLEHAKGDAIISMDADMQHPPNIMPKLIAKWREGNEIVYTTRQDSQDSGLLKRLLSRFFYTFASKISGIKLEPGTADFRLIDAKILSVLNNFKESNLFYRGIIPWIGFKKVAVPYQADARFSGKSKYSLIRMFRLALVGLSFHSVRPLYVAVALGLMMCFFSLLYAGYAVYMHFVMKDTVSGWTSLVILHTFLGGVQLVVLGFVGHYIGQISENIKARPNYIVAEKNF
ncbi:MAG: hypothetical protein A2X86_02745 [Bdellovibrionales bacterium GWA2_49_15]|nr:MAG: hypothetical protein A2X86_02745 [Bdellovibrionales bacterium GWA2_49_15]HAZ14143.1 glycosyltransferase [Bdellovibrionales bacterium]